MFKKREFYVDIYGFLRVNRILSVDWKRGEVYHIPDFEKPEIERVDLGGKRKEKYLIDINPEKFKVERGEFELWYQCVMDETDSFTKSLMKHIPYIPPHSPALMGIKVIGDWLMIITGKRDWKKGENEVLVYGLPSLKYEGSFFIPFPNRFRTKWYDSYYIIEKLIKNDEGYYSSYEIYAVEER